MPECPEELHPAQYLHYLELGTLLGSGAISAPIWKERWAAYLLGLPAAMAPILREEAMAELEAVAARISVGFLLEQEPPRLNFNSTVNLLPEYQGSKGPGDWLNGMTFGEFIQCSTLMGVLTGAPEDESTYNEIARIMYHLPEGTEADVLLKFHCVALFGAVWRAIQAGPIEINGSPIDFSIIFKPSGAKKADDKTGWTGVTFEVASAGLFGNVSEVERADLWAVLLYLYKCKFEYLHDKQ